MALLRDLVILFFSLAIFSLSFSIRISSICLFFGSVFWCLYGIVGKKLVFKNFNIFFIILIWFSYNIISLLNTTNLKAGIFSLEKQLSILFIPLIFSTFHFSKKNVHLFFKIFIFSLLLSTIVCYAYAFIFRFQIEHVNQLNRIDWAYFSYSLTEIIKFHHVYYALYVVWAISILLYWLFYLNPIDKLKKGVLIFLIIYFLAFAILLSSRTALVAMIFILLFFTILYIRKTKKYLVASLIIASLIIIGIVSFQNVPYLNSKFEDIFTYGISNNPRGYIFPLSVELIKDNLLLGVGLGDSHDKLMHIYALHDYQEGILYGFNSHNQFLDTLIWGGIIGLLILIIHIVSTLNHAFRSKQLLYFIFLLLFWFCSISEVVLATQKGMVLYAFFSSVFLFTDYGINERHKKKYESKR